MSFLKRMYQRAATSPVSNKNPNRVSGGLRAQGVDKVTFVTETGTEQSVATSKYVQSLEERVRANSKRIQSMEARIAQLARQQQTRNTTRIDVN